MSHGDLGEEAAMAVVGAMANKKKLKKLNLIEGKQIFM